MSRRREQLRSTVLTLEQQRADLQSDVALSREQSFSLESQAQGKVAKKQDQLEAILLETRHIEVAFLYFHSELE